MCVCVCAYVRVCVVLCLCVCVCVCVCVCLCVCCVCVVCVYVLNCGTVVEMYLRNVSCMGIKSSKYNTGRPLSYKIQLL